ncbi:MAG: protein kinase [Victivallales bacterium]|nr:protein kinase [Victivallales bacterium]
MQAVSVPDYQLIAKCGRGSFGDVYVARSLSGCLVALKVIEKNNYSAKEFNGLKYYCSRCADSPFLIKIFHTGETESFFYYTMELADNFGDDDNYIPETLANRLIKNKRLEPHAVRKLALNLLSGLKTLHSAGLVHRDIKPENIIFVNDVPKLSDIGLVSAVSATFSVGGTLGFIPPEKLTSSSGSKTETDDLYALGKLIYCVFSGNSPDKFPSLPHEIELDDDTRRLNEVVMVACNADSLLRFNSIDKFSKALMTSVSRKRRVVNSIWRHRHIWEVVILLLSVSLFLLLNPLIVNYREIASRIITMQKPPVIINSVNKLHNISGEQFLVLSGISSFKDSGQGEQVPGANIIRNIELPPVISDYNFRKLMKRQLDIPSLTACTLNIEYYLIEQGSKRFPELEKEYSAFLTSLAGIQNLMFCA